MLILKADTGKSEVLEYLSRDKNNVIYVYTDTNFDFRCVMILPKDYTANDLANMIKYDLEQHKYNYYNFVIIYTNLDESRTAPIKYLLKTLEKDGVCKYGMLMCK